MRMYSRPLFAVLSLLALCLLGAGFAWAAEINAQPKNGYQRLNLAFKQPTTMKVEQRGNTLILHFSQPVRVPPSAFASALNGYAKSASIAPNGRDVTLVMNKRYRTRQFVSGNALGLDIIGAPDKTVEAKAIAPETERPRASEVLTTKKSEPPVAVKPVEKPSAIAKAENTSNDEALLSTKKALPAAEPEAEPKPAPTAKPEAPSKIAATAAAKSDPAPEKQAETKAPAVEPAPTKKEEAPVAVEAPPGKGFWVTAKLQDGVTRLHFPYQTRTAAAVFERPKTIWLVFSEPAAVNLSQLRSILPTAIAEVTQYGYQGNTVLRLRTDGTLHASAETAKGNYGWDILLSPGATPAAAAAPLSIDKAPNGKRLLIGAFDVAPGLRFYDPVVGDLLLVAPSFENGRGVKFRRGYPGINVLPTNQGIAVSSTLDDVTISNSRLGVAIESKHGLEISDNLEVFNAESAQPVEGLATGVMLPYEKWYVPAADFRAKQLERFDALMHATAESRPEALLSLATLYLGQGYGAEAIGYLTQLRNESPAYYTNNKLALLMAAADILQNRPEDMAAALQAPELDGFKEAEFWREYASLFAPPPSPAQAVQQDAAAATAAPSFSLAEDVEQEASEAQPQEVTAAAAPSKPVLRFLKYNKSFIRFYPPRLRQRIAVDAANGYIANGLEEKALATFDTLNRDGILKPVERHAEYALALQAIKNKKNDEAEKLFARLSRQTDDPFIQARARATYAMWLMNRGDKTAAETADTLEAIRISWRGDLVDHDILKTLAAIYKDLKRPDDALRALKAFTETFPEDPDFLSISGEMGEMFEMLYLQGEADKLPPLKSLALFYEFRDLIPVGEKGDLIIQKLADRLAAFDLLDRATQLLENQINFRVSGEVRSRVGARLALLYLLNHQPQEALKVLEVTNFGANSPELQRQRLELAAQALNTLGQHEDALNVLKTDHSPAGELLKLDILWSSQDWPNVVNQAEDILAKRVDLTAPLTPSETEVLLKLALGYSFEGDYTQLRYLRDYYGNLLQDNGYKQIFDFITNDTSPLDREDSTLLTQQISRTESFLSTFKEKIAAGKLSEAVK